MQDLRFQQCWFVQHWSERKEVSLSHGCNSDNLYQMFYLDSNNLIKNRGTGPDHCLELVGSFNQAARPPKIAMQKCNNEPTQKWTYNDEKRIVSNHDGTCLQNCCYGKLCSSSNCREGIDQQFYPQSAEFQRGSRGLIGAEGSALKILQLGDSYSAGNGYDHSGPGWEGPGNHPGCIRHTQNWGRRVSKKLEDRGYHVHYTNKACSGSLIRHITEDYDLETGLSKDRGGDCGTFWDPDAVVTQEAVKSSWWDPFHWDKVSSCSLDI